MKAAKEIRDYPFSGHEVNEYQKREGVLFLERILTGDRTRRQKGAGTTIAQDCSLYSVIGQKQTNQHLNMCYIYVI